MVPAVEELDFRPVFYSFNPLSLCYRISVPILFSDEDLKDDERSEIGVFCCSALSDMRARSNL